MLPFLTSLGVLTDLCTSIDYTLMFNIKLDDGSKIKVEIEDFAHMGVVLPDGTTHNASHLSIYKLLDSTYHEQNSGIVRSKTETDLPLAG